VLTAVNERVCLCVCDSSVSSSDGGVCYIQVLVESPTGELMPVKIPATVIANNNDNDNAAAAAATPALNVVHLASSSSSSPVAGGNAVSPLAAAAASITDVKAVSSSSGITLATKQASRRLHLK